METYLKAFEFVTDGTDKPQKIEHGLDMHDIVNVRSVIEVNTTDGVYCIPNDRIVFSDKNIMISPKQIPQLSDKGICVKIVLTYNKKSECKG